MLAAERRAQLLAIVNRRGMATVDELQGEVGGSSATIRRDINLLADNGLLAKTHGGAVSLASSLRGEPPLVVKSELHVEEKRRIGLAARGLIRDNEFVIFDSGTTILELARQVADAVKFTAVVYDLLIAMELAQRQNVDLVMLGGVLRKNYYSFYGHYTEDMLRSIYADKAFIAMDSVDAERGLCNYSTEDLAVKKLLFESAREIILLCDHSKFSARSPLRIRGFDRVDRIITGAEADPAVVERLREQGIAVDTV